MKTILPLLYKDLTNDELIMTIKRVYQIVQESEIEEENKNHFHRMFQQLLEEINAEIKRREEEDIKHTVIEEKDERDQVYTYFYNQLLSISYSDDDYAKQYADLLLKEIRYRNFSRELIDLRSEVHVLQGLIEHFKENPYREAIEGLGMQKLMTVLEEENQRLQKLLDRYHEQRLKPDLTLNQKAKQLYQSYRMAKSFIETGVNVLSLSGFEGVMNRINVAIQEVTQQVRIRKKKAKQTNTKEE